MSRAGQVALVLAGSVVLLASCSGAQSKAQAQLGAIYAGCKVSLDIERDAGAAGAEDDTAEGCRAALRTWEKQP